MVTASKGQQGRPLQHYTSHADQAVGQSETHHVGTDPSSWPHARPAEDTGSIGAGSSREFFPGVGHGTSVAESTESYSNVPLCFGEQLVLETYVRYKGRSYDRQRQDELSQPRRHKGDAWAFGAQRGEMMDENEKVLHKHQVQNLVARLARPKRHQSNEDAGQMVTLHSMRDEALKRQSAADVEALVKRLAAPKKFRAYDPTPGERVCMVYNRWNPTQAVDLGRLADMAKPKKRGGRAESWGVGSRSIRLEGNVSMTSTPRDHSSIMQQLPPAPVSARQGTSSPGAGQDSARPTETSRIERLPEVVDDYSYPRTIDTNRIERSPEEPNPAPSSYRGADPYQGSATTSSTVAAAAENWKPVESRPPVAQGLFKPLQPVESRPPVVQDRRMVEPQESHWPSSVPREAEAEEPGMSFLKRTADGNHDEDYSDDYESDNPVSYRPAALQSNSLGRPHAGAFVPSAPAQPVQSSYPGTLQQGMEEEESEDEDEPFFPQFGFAGQRTRPPPSLGR